MRVPRRCAVCTTEFLAINRTQLYCKRRCFKKAYYKKTKAKLEALGKRSAVYSCPICDHDTVLSFDPVKQWIEFTMFVCPHCGISRQDVFTHRFDLQWDRSFVRENTSTANYVISSAIVAEVPVSFSTC